MADQFQGQRPTKAEYSGTNGPSTTADVVQVESVQDAAGHLLSRLRSISSSLARIEGPQAEAAPEPKLAERMGICEALERCHNEAADLDRRVHNLAAKVGML